MFKNLKKKLEQGVAQTSLRAAAAVSAISKADDQNSTFSNAEKKETYDVGKPLAESTPQKSSTQGSGNGEFVSPVLNSISTAPKDAKFSDIPVGQLVDIPLEGAGESLYETASDAESVRGDETPRGPRSRTSSVSSVTSDSSFFQVPNFSSHYVIPSDVESEMEESSSDLSGISKEDLYTYVKKFERRAFKYKSKFMDLVSHYKEILGEREKLKSTLTQSQDRAFRRMSELREQLQLDQIAKRDLEDNYRLLLDERNEYVKVCKHR
ncbi:golgin subfamily A member 4-like [Pomacea canaliculata]|uniref:golgin subfamily A member 4-like n=1 Tax=Pomacea canaliculata TaxID=400727 RepID=UPI000D737F57|nr:golgin subfamily A member 4-like [Pomacea canaliculata]